MYRIEAQKKISDIDFVRDIVRKIQPETEANVRCLRLGKKCEGHPRTLCVSFASKESTLSIL